MNRREKLREARARIDVRANELQERFRLPFSLSAFAREIFNAGYEAAEPDVCARCGAEIEGGE